MKRDSMTSKTRAHGRVFSHGALFFRLSGRAPRFCVAAGGPFFAVLRVTTVTLLRMATFLVTARFFFVLVDGAARFCGTARGPFLAVLRVTTERLLRVATFLVTARFFFVLVDDAPRFCGTAGGPEHQSLERRDASADLRECVPAAFAPVAPQISVPSARPGALEWTSLGFGVVRVKSLKLLICGSPKVSMVAMPSAVQQQLPVFPSRALG